MNTKDDFFKEYINIGSAYWMERCGFGWVVATAKQSEMTQIAELRVAMRSKCTHNGSITNYET